MERVGWVRHVDSWPTRWVGKCELDVVGAWDEVCTVGVLSRLAKHGVGRVGMVG